MESRLMLAAHIIGSGAVYPTIQAAVNAASAGATITVDPGTYAEKVTIAEPLTLQGAQAGVNATSRINGGSGNESIVTGAPSNGGQSCGFYIAASGVTIDGFTIQGESDPNSQADAGIVIAPNQSGTRILNNIIQNNVAGLLLANDSSGNAALVQHNFFGYNNNDGDDSGRGIYTDQSVSGGDLTNVTIDSNTFVDNYGSDGVEAACAFQATDANEQSNIRITNNVMTGNGKAVLFFNASNVLIQNNTITGSIDQGSAALRFEGNNHSVTIVGNTADNNTAPALAVDSKGVPGDSSGFVVNNNDFFNNNTAHSPALSAVFNDGNYDGAFDVRNNWWGSASGPSGDGPGNGDAVSAATLKSGAAEGWNLASGGGELFSPWLTAPAGTVAPPPVVPVVPPTVPVTPPTAVAVPTGLTAVAASSAQVNLAWTDAAPGVETGFIIQRSAGGQAFAQIGTAAAGVTAFQDKTVAAGLSYAYRVQAASASGSSAFSASASVAVPAAAAPVTTGTPLSSLAWVSATTGYGVIHENLSVDGNPLTLNGIAYATGIGTHALSQIVYNLNGKYARFTSNVGIDSEVGAATGEVDFQVIGDGKVLFNSGVLTTASPTVSLSVSVTGVKQLTLLASNGIPGNINYDHADWAGAQLYAATATTPPPPTTPTPPTAPSAPASPTGLKAAVLSANQVKLTWISAATGVSGFIISRGVDGVHFTQIGTAAAGATSYTDSSGLAAGQTYYYQVVASAGGVNSAASNVASATLPAAVPTTAPTATPTYLSSLAWVSATSGWKTVRKNASVDGNTISLRGKTYAQGLGANANSQIVYNLAGRYTTFLSDIGIDDETIGQGKGAAIFQVIGDGKVLYTSGVLTAASPIVSLNINVAGVKQLTLKMTNGIANTLDHDHGDWAGARLI